MLFLLCRHHPVLRSAMVFDMLALLTGGWKHQTRYRASGASFSVLEEIGLASFLSVIAI